MVKKEQKPDITTKLDTKASAKAAAKSSPLKPQPPPAQPRAAAAVPPPFNVEALIKAQKAVLSSGLQNQLAALARPRSPPSTTSQLRARHDSGSADNSEDNSEADKAKQRNYKNMTRERRVEANARERQRVHTITAAFDTLQAAIPTEEKDIKLSKLSVIKIATAYIMALSRMAGHDYTEDQSAPPVEEVIAHCSDVIEKETRIKKRNGSP